MVLVDTVFEDLSRSFFGFLSECIVFGVKLLLVEESLLEVSF